MKNVRCGVVVPENLQSGLFHTSNSHMCEEGE